MNVLVVGGGKVGRNLTSFLVEQDRHAVTLIERSEEMAHKLAAALPQALIVEGDGCDPAVLREAGVERMDAVAAVTGDDEDNLVIALLFKREFQVRRVAARVNNPKNTWLFNARMGVDVPVDDARVIARNLEADINVGAIVRLLRLREGHVALVELTVAPDSSAIGKSVQTLDLPAGCVLVALLRDEAVIIPAGDTSIAAGDQVLAVARVEHEAALAERFR